MNNLESEELDRELVLSHVGSKEGPYAWSAHKATVNQKTLTLHFGNHSKMKFSKRNFIGDGLEINVEVIKQKYKQCSLGHQHPDGVEKAWDSLTLQWENVEGLVEWINHGSWTEIRGLESPYIKVLRECDDMLLICEKDKILKGSIQKIRVKIKALLKEKEKEIHGN